MSRQSDLDNHANQMNPNSDAYWQSRGEDEWPDDWVERAEQDGVKSERNTSQVEALDIKDEVLTNKTATRYYSGRTIGEYSLRQIYVTLGKRLVGLGIVPIPPLFEQHDVSMANITTASMARLVKKWDSLCATIQTRSGRIQDYGQATEDFCRLLVIDLALRIVAWLRLAKLPPPEPKTPPWAEENGAGKMLRVLLSKAGITRDQFSARVEVTHISIDNWFDGRIRPTPNHIEIMADTFSTLIPGAKKYVLRVQFQRQFTLAYLADILAKKMGRVAVIELASALYRFIWLISENINTMTRPPIEEVAGLEFEILRHGTDEPHSHTLLRNLALVEMDTQWKKDILASTTGWGLRFEEIASSSRSAPLSCSFLGALVLGLMSDIASNFSVQELECPQANSNRCYRLERPMS